MEREQDGISHSSEKRTPQEEANAARAELHGFIQHTHELIAGVGDAETRRAGRMADFTDAERAAYVEAVEDIDPPLAERYSAAEALFGAVVAILSDGLPDGAVLLDDDSRYLKERVGAAINAYGLTVVQQETNRHETRRRFRRLRKLRTVYTATHGDRASEGPLETPAPDPDDSR